MSEVDGDKRSECVGMCVMRGRTSMSDGIVTINGRTMIQVLPRCKIVRGHIACGICGQTENLQAVFSSAHNATLIEHCDVVQFVREGWYDERN